LLCAWATPTESKKTAQKPAAKARVKLISHPFFDSEQDFNKSVPDKEDLKNGIYNPEYGCIPPQAYHVAHIARCAA
jgi:hypothetical protein